MNKCLPLGEGAPPTGGADEGWQAEPIRLTYVVKFLKAKYFCLSIPVFGVVPPLISQGCALPASPEGKPFYAPSTNSSIFSFGMTPVCRSGFSRSAARFAGMGTPVSARRRSMRSYSLPEVSPPMAVRTAVENL